MLLNNIKPSKPFSNGTEYENFMYYCFGPTVTKKEKKMSENINESWVGITEAALHLGVTKETIRNWIKKKNIPAHRVGKLWKFKLSELDEWVKSGKSANIDTNHDNLN